jgi:hypothetical protein
MVGVTVGMGESGKMRELKIFTLSALKILIAINQKG